MGVLVSAEPYCRGQGGASGALILARLWGWVRSGFGEDATSHFVGRFVPCHWALKRFCRKACGVSLASLLAEDLRRSQSFGGTGLFFSGNPRVHAGQGFRLKPLFFCCSLGSRGREFGLDAKFGPQ